MTTTTNAPKRAKRERHTDRITLTKASIDRLDSWKVAVASRLAGQRLGRGDLVNWLISAHAADLSSDEASALVSERFDPVRALEWAVHCARSAAKRGETVNLDDLVGTAMATSSQVKRMKRPKRGKGKMGQPALSECHQPDTERIPAAAQSADQVQVEAQAE
jgi:hypothetical protein